MGSLNLTHVELEGLSDALKKMSGPGVEAKGVKAHFSLDESGILSLAGAELSFEKTVTESEEKAAEEDGEDSPLSKLGSTISKLFSGEDDPKLEAPAAEEETASTPAPPPSNESVPTEAPKPKVTVVKESLKVVEEMLDLSDLEGAQLKKSKKK